MASWHLPPLKLRLVLGLCVFARTTTQKNSNFLPKISLQHYGFKAGSPRPPAKGVQSMTNMFQQDSACRKQKNVTCLVNNRPPHLLHGWFPRLEMQGPAPLQAQGFAEGCSCSSQHLAMLQGGRKSPREGKEHRCSEKKEKEENR